jgi:hypothetical protein
LKSLWIGSIEIPLRSVLDLDQTYEPIGGESILRTLSGIGIKQQTWSRLRVVTSGGGWIPPGLAALDCSTQQTVACVVPRTIAADVNRQATLPAARRADAGCLPYGLALLDDSRVVEVAASLAGNVATAAAYSGAGVAVGYLLAYYPLLTCWLLRPTESGSRAEATHRWELVAEEV